MVSGSTVYHMAGLYTTEFEPSGKYSTTVPFSTDKPVRLFMKPQWDTITKSSAVLKRVEYCLKNFVSEKVCA